ncbi:MAG: GGDEF domain-containing protein [Butyrivibrio sp.]|jgi:hypothetical protein|nr:GGDEF domain-containing protein [Butyrivibrio sp.]
MKKKEFDIRYLLELHNIIMKMEKSRRRQFYERKVEYYQFWVIGLGSSGLAGLCPYAAFFAELILSNAFNHYTNFEIIMSLNIPCAIAVVMLDIDLFKNVNDTYGHYTGDQVLRYLGKKLTEDVRKSDYVIRYGGEEILILMNECSVSEAYAHMENIRADIQNANDRPAPFTISAGVAS